MNDSISLGNIGETGRQPRKERRDAAENRQRILETAEKLFSERGVSNVCMSEIAQAAGVGKGTLYRRFANKAELCLALMDTQMSEFQNRMLGRIQRMTEEDVPKMQQLEAFLDSLVHFTDVHAPLLTEVQTAELVPMEGNRLSLPHFWQFMTVNGLLRQAVQQGEIANDVDIEYLADALLAPLKIDLFAMQRNVRGFSLARISAGLQMIVRAFTNDFS